MDWNCPACGRRFARRKQAHSCKTRSTADHFRGKPAKLRALFRALVRALERTGPLRTDAVESTINLVSQHHFGGVAVRGDHLRIGFIAERAIRSPRIARVQRVGARRVLHHVTVRAASELDAELLGWLSVAQALQARSRS